MTTSSHDFSKTGVQETIKSIAERLHGSASVKTVFGEPIEAKGKIIVPVARVFYGFGAGRGREASGRDQEPGAGAGGGVVVRPAGVLEITQEGTRFIPIRGRKLGVLLLGFALGVFMAAACCRRGRRD